MTTEFSGYEKIPSNLKKLGFSEKDFSELEKLKWVVTEKIHGANFSFIYENGSLRFAKRKAYLNWTDDFFGFQLVVNQLEEKVFQLFEAVSRKYDASKILLYGELFGGAYPHPEVAINSNVFAIQTGVYYCPNIEFCAFDLAIETDGSESKYYIDYEAALSYFEQFEIFHAKPLFVGKFNEAINFDPRIDSKVPTALGLPILADNLIEGIVIKPYNQVLHQKLGTRPIFKVKNKEFEEEKKFHEAEKWSFIPNVTSKSEELTFILDEMRNYVNQNRFQSAISKIGAADFSNPERIAELETEFLNDLIHDFNENNANILKELPESDYIWIIARISSEIEKCVHSN